MCNTVFYRTKKERDYTVINNIFLKDARLSWKAKGLFAYLLSLPEDWKLYQKELETRSADGELSLRNGLKELINFGYIIRQRVKTKDGKFDGIAYEIVENPENSVSSPKRDFPLTDNAQPENQFMENQELLNTNNSKYMNKENTKLNNVSFGKHKKSSSPKKETLHGIIENFTNNQKLREALQDFLDHYKQITKINPSLKQFKLLLEDLETLTKESINIPKDMIYLVNLAIKKGWRGFYGSPQYNSNNGGKQVGNLNIKEDETLTEEDIELADEEF